ncbi:hypothetical protein DL96DRAFT_1573176, partial [Flagelloscypha sp. PMI_526]
RRLWHRSLVQFVRPWPTRSHSPYSSCSSSVELQHNHLSVYHHPSLSTIPDLSDVQAILTERTHNAASIISLVRSRQEFARIFENPKQVLSLLRDVSASTHPSLASEILIALSRMGRPLKQNVFENVCHYLVRAGRWKHVLLIVALGQTMTNKTTRRLLNWRILALVNTQRYGALNSVLLDFTKCNIPPDRRTFHLLIDGHLQNRDLEQARSCLAQMRALDILPDASTQAKIAQAYRYIGSDPSVDASTLAILPDLAANDPPSATKALNHLLQMRLVVLDYAGVLNLLSYFHHNQVKPYFDLVAQSMGLNPADLVVPLQDANTGTFALFLHFTARQGDEQTCLSLIEMFPSLGLELDETILIALVHALAAHDHSQILHMVSSMRRNTALDDFFAECQTFLTVAPRLPVDFLLSALRPMEQAGLEPNHTTLEIMLRQLRAINPRLKANSRELLSFYRYYNKYTRNSPHLNHLHQVLAGQMLKAKRLVHGGSSWRQVFNHLSDVEHPIARLESPVRAASPMSKLSATLIRRGVRSDASVFLNRMKYEGLIKRDLAAMHRAFDEMVNSGIQPNGYHIAAMMEGHVYSKDMKGAKEAMGLASNFALRIFKDMTGAGIQPDMASIDALCGAFYAAGAATIARRMLIAFWPEQHPLPADLDNQKLIELLRLFRGLAVRQVLGEKMTKQDILIAHMKIKILLGEWKQHSADEQPPQWKEERIKKWEEAIEAKRQQKLAKSSQKNAEVRGQTFWNYKVMEREGLPQESCSAMEEVPSPRLDASRVNW